MVTTKTVTISNVWDKASFEKPRNRIVMAEEPDDLLIALNCYSPGEQNEMHFHVGTGQSFLVLKGPVLLRHRSKELPEEQTEEVTLKEGDCILIPADVYYSMRNPGPHQVILYQAKQPGDIISVQGKGVMNVREYFTPERTAKKGAL